jgi:hypothetical protein
LWGYAAVKRGELTGGDGRRGRDLHCRGEGEEDEEGKGREGEMCEEEALEEEEEGNKGEAWRYGSRGGRGEEFDVFMVWAVSGNYSNIWVLMLLI